MASTTLSLLLLLFLLASGVHAQMNPIDRCWRRDPNWSSHRPRLAACSVGYAGKMRNNRGRGLTKYTVTDPGDHPLRPRPGTLRYGATLLPGKVWITFRRDMTIKLDKPLLVKSSTTLDGRGADVHIAQGAGLLIHRVSDGIRVVTARKVWIDHNTLYKCEDGLIDVTRGSTGVTISNNWFRDHDKVMLLGHDDGYVRDRNMKVTVAFNRFGPNCNQRMPRVRHGYAHVANNLYEGWRDYAIGGSMKPNIKSQANKFIASKTGNKKVTWSTGGGGLEAVQNWRSVNDAFINGAFFGARTGKARVAGPGYNRQQRFRAGSATTVTALTRDAGAIRCSTRSRC